MAIVEMQKLSVCALKRNRKTTLETLQKLGVMEIVHTKIEDDALRYQNTNEARQSFVKRAETFENALTILDTCDPEKKGLLSSFAGEENIDRSVYEKCVAENGEIFDRAKEVVDDDKRISEFRGAIQKNRARQEQLAPWSPLEVPMDCTGTDKTSVFIGTVSGVVDEAGLCTLASDGISAEGAVSGDVLFTTNDTTGISLVCLKKDADKVLENLRAHGFSKPAQVESEIPSVLSEKLEEENSGYEKRIEALTEEIKTFGKDRENFRIMADYFRTRAEKYRLLGDIPQTENAFFLEGWVPKDKAERVIKVLTEKCGAAAEVEDAGDEEPPTLLHNNPFSRNSEGVLASYGLPKKGNIDPTFIMSLFYVVFFGMMLSDAGYGLVMAIGCAVLIKKCPHMGEGLGKMIRLFFWCGLSTTFWGLMYGSFFGDLIDVVAKTFFGYTGDTIFKPLWFEPLKDPMTLLVYCLLFGLIHLLMGVAIGGYQHLLDKDVVGFISDSVSWFILVVGLVLILLPTDIFQSISGMTFVFPSWLNMLAKVLTIAGLLIILVMSGRSKGNHWGIRLVLGAYDIYGITGWLSDVLSYSRLLALGMATGVIASVINMMASMVAGSAIGVVLFIIIELLGHTLNIAINALGAYVHTNRLQYVEFFGKFYEGGGEPFQPFTTDTKYIDLKEEA